jgi:hypothetical protein
MFLVSYPHLTTFQARCQISTILINSCPPTPENINTKSDNGMLSDGGRLSYYISSHDLR